MGLLMDRFDGVFPLAVASYNYGPHNVSAWLSGTGQDMPIDAFVEIIPFRETRNYVKSVTGNYATYLALYAPEGTTLLLDPTPHGDDASVVDF
jgi:soluble lytic murein transglycosylase-like protein